MSNKFWDLTPRDTNPIEGSHAQDNRVSSTNHSLIEAILHARQFDSDNARVIKASLEFGIWENGNNSTRPRFSSQAARQARTRERNAKAEKSEVGSKHLKTKLAAAERLVKEEDAEIQHLRSQLNLGRPAFPFVRLNSRAGPSKPQRQAGPSSPRREGSFSPTFIDVDSTPDDIHNSSPIAGPSKLPELLFSGLLCEIIWDLTVKFKFGSQLASTPASDVVWANLFERIRLVMPERMASV
ncbi:hypothetical protein B0H13DRAFT_1851318 [Mycena leptocephala]|nr:hypothetical protein B0H13DRAFT_1851318 [Mycena leptocephala]